MPRPLLEGCGLLEPRPPFSLSHVPADDFVLLLCASQQWRVFEAERCEEWLRAAGKNTDRLDLERDPHNPTPNFIHCRWAPAPLLGLGHLGTWGWDPPGMGHLRGWTGWDPPGSGTCWGSLVWDPNLNTGTALGSPDPHVGLGQEPSMAGTGTPVTRIVPRLRQEHPGLCWG